MKADTRQVGESIPKGWDDLVAMHPLRPIHDEVALENATEVLDAMAGHDLNADQEDYLDALSTLVEAYEAKHHPVGVNITGREALRALLEDHGMTGADLGRLLGVHRSHAAKVLKGQRTLTARHLRILSDRFKVSADLFLD